MTKKVCDELEKALRAQRHQFINHIQVVHALIVPHGSQDRPAQTRSITFPLESNLCYDSSYEILPASHPLPSFEYHPFGRHHPGHPQLVGRRFAVRPGWPTPGRPDRFGRTVDNLPLGPTHTAAHPAGERRFWRCERPGDRDPGRDRSWRS